MTQNQPQQSPFQPIHTGGFNTEPPEGWTSFSVKGTTSFAAIHSEVSVNVVYSSTQPVGTRRNAGRGPEDGEALGESRQVRLLEICYCHF